MKKIIYAPNVHVGGGFVLLKSLLDAFFSCDDIVIWLDIRAKHLLVVPNKWTVYWVEPYIGSRLKAEFLLYSNVNAEDVVLCFHGLPPLFKLPCKVHLFQQNRILFGKSSLESFKFRTRIRINLEQLISFYFRKRITYFWVQTPSMAHELATWYIDTDVNVTIFPFISNTVSNVKATPESKHDFIYVADGEAHKNHKVLIEAWIILSKKGVKPTLTITLSDRDSTLKQWVREMALRFNLDVKDIGVKPHADILNYYSSAKALIFPSKSESFGLPLIEAAKIGLPILASELDFVRDVCDPIETFDPTSAVSIARAVCRFLKVSEDPLKFFSAADFADVVFKN